MANIEGLGVFYLGKGYDLASQKTTEEVILYDSRRMTTHAVCVGMTGSGKTGLCVGLLEEAALDGIPAIAIDPKGDISNLLLSFPDLLPSDFRPFVDEGEAERQGLTVDALAERAAAAQRDGLVAWGEDGARIRRFRDACELALYTPGSEAGLPLSLLRSFSLPDSTVLDDAELLAGQIEGTVSGLLGLIGIDAEPLRSREHVLLSQILGAAWTARKGLDLAGLIQSVQTPPFARIGVIELDTFYPRSERTALAIALNSLLASPSASAWAQGEPLDIQRLLYGAQGKPKISILSIAHLSDAQRMFFVTALLDALVAWMRQQSGTSSLRALLYMDEIFGYFPPTAAPPSKRPMLLLLKQARAFGLGVVLATQNPVDLDYKGLANCGTWFLGRLQTERDKLRVLEGLESASGQASGGGFDRAALDHALSTLGSRVFVMNDVREAAPIVFQTRQTLSFLRGPLSREQIKALMAGKKAEVSASLPQSREVSAAATLKPAPADGLSEIFVAALPGAGTLLYKPAFWAVTKLHYVDAKSATDVWVKMAFVAALDASDVELDWSKASLAAADFATRATGERAPEATFLPLTKLASEAKPLAGSKKTLLSHLYENCPLTLSDCKVLRLTSAAGEDSAAFRARVSLAAREARDGALAQVKQKYDAKFAKLRADWDGAEAKVSKERAEAKASQVDALAQVGSTVLGALLGRSPFTASTVRRGASVVKSAGRASKQHNDVARAEAKQAELSATWSALQAEANAALQAVQLAWDPAKLELQSTRIAARKSDIEVVSFNLLWLPFRREREGTPVPAFAWP